MLKVIKEVSKEEFIDFLYDIDIRDENLYKEANSDNYLGIFQFNGNTAEELVKKIHPDNFEELVAINSLARPGTSSFADQYLHNKHHKEHSTYPEPVSALLQDTYRTILYQEQVMAVFNKIGGFSLEETNGVRNLMKKLGKADKKEDDIKKWEATVGRFVDGATNNGVTRSEATKIADELLQLSSYSFNKSHAVAYTYNAVMTLYLSYYFRPYYYSSVLTYEVDRKINLLTALQSVKKHGIEILPPDINKSGFFFSPVDDKNIVFGLSNIKFVGEKPANSIIANRPYTSLIDFIIKNQGEGVNKRVVEALISVGCFDSVDKNRKKLLLVMNQFYERKKSVKVVEKLLNLYNQIDKEVSMLPGLTTTYNDLVTFEKEFFDFNFFYSVFSPKLKDMFTSLSKRGLIELSFDKIGVGSAKVPVFIKQVRAFNDKNGKEMAFVEIEDMVGESTSIPIFQSYWKVIGKDIVAGTVILMNLYRDKEDKLLFGTSSWVDSEERMRRMIKKIPAES